MDNILGGKVGSISSFITPKVISDKFTVITDGIDNFVITASIANNVVMVLINVPANIENQVIRFKINDSKYFPINYIAGAFASGSSLSDKDKLSAACIYTDGVGYAYFSSPLNYGETISFVYTVDGRNILL